MVGRVKMKIWSERFGRWRTVHVLYYRVDPVIKKLREYGIKFEVVCERVDSIPMEDEGTAEAA
jgi:hypothetical protein